VKLLQNHSLEASHLFFNICWKNVSGRSNVFIISKRQSSLSNKFYDRYQPLQVKTICNIVRIDWPDWPVLYQFFIVINFYEWFIFMTYDFIVINFCTSMTKCNRGVYMFHWMLVAPQALKSVLPVEDSFSNKEMHTFDSIRARQSTSETFNRSLWRRKTTRFCPLLRHCGSGDE